MPFQIEPLPIFGYRARMAGLPRKERASARKPRVVDWLSLREERSHTTTGSEALAWRSLHTIRGTVTPADTTAGAVALPR